MKKTDFKIFQTFHSKGDAEAFVAFFEENSIRYRFDRNYDVIRTNPEHEGSILIKPGESLQNELALTVHTDDFDKAHDLLQQDVEKITEIPDEHYILQFDNNELQDIIQHPDEWNKHDVHFAKLLLKQREA
ncbi:hypothetical protein BKI52_43580 [marine bacterium AO1-C]|nr:hypothetical protein BKI52_43580 [marine bacterium AO1-C]